MSVSQKNIEFYQRRSNCEVIVIAAWDLGQNSAGVSGGRATILNRGGANRGLGGL